jgi:peptide/nickel transport system ATP-binding protein
MMSTATATSVEAPALVLSDLVVRAPSGDVIVDHVSLTLPRGAILGVVGESGSGKTTMALAALGYTQAGAVISSGSVEINGTVIDVNDERQLRRTRGRLVSYVPQNPGTALNPSGRVGDAIAEVLRNHRDAAVRNDSTVVVRTLSMVGLPGDQEFARRYPHQLSGGQQQRVCIAASLACEPPVVILDEPTTGLDVVTQERILQELVRLRDTQEISMLYVTHDLAVVAQIATHVAVMYAGRIVEWGRVEDVLARPRHPYTRGLLTSVPDHQRPVVLQPIDGVAVGISDRSSGCAFAPRCPLSTTECEVAVPELTDVGEGHAARCVHIDKVRPIARVPVDLSAERVTASIDPVLAVRHLVAEHRSNRKVVVAASDVTFDIARGSCTALVGESGSGKTTIARTIAGLHPIGGGEVCLNGKALPRQAKRRSREQRRAISLVFQNPAEALNPRLIVGDTVGRAATVLLGMTRRDARTETDRMLDLVRLPRSVASRYPSELSGGEKQRIGLARALISRPDVVVCDEVTSALDVSVQAAVLTLLIELRRELELAMLFISHDFGVVAAIADQVLVLDSGVVCESGPTGRVLLAPQHPYTQRLLTAAPTLPAAS